MRAVHTGLQHLLADHHRRSAVAAGDGAPPWRPAAQPGPGLRWLLRQRLRPADSRVQHPHRGSGHRRHREDVCRDPVSGVRGRPAERRGAVLDVLAAAEPWLPGVCIRVRLRRDRRDGASGQPWGCQRNRNRFDGHQPVHCGPMGNRRHGVVSADGRDWHGGQEHSLHLPHVSHTDGADGVPVLGAVGSALGLVAPQRDAHRGTNWSNDLGGAGSALRHCAVDLRLAGRVRPGKRCWRYRRQPPVR